MDSMVATGKRTEIFMVDVGIRTIGLERKDTAIAR